MRLRRRSSHLCHMPSLIGGSGQWFGPTRMCDDLLEDDCSMDEAESPSSQQPRGQAFYTLLKAKSISDSDLVKGLKGIIDPLDSSVNDEALEAGIDSLIQFYRSAGSSVTANSEHLREFVNFYCEKMLITVVTPPASPGSSRANGSLVQVDSFSCPVCYGIFIEPVTIECGHSYCRKCLQKERTGKSCRRCKHILGPKDLAKSNVNVLVNSLVDKWWPSYVAAYDLRGEGNRLFDGNEGEKALVKYSQAIDLCHDDHLSLGNRAQILLTLGRSEEALKDAEAAIKSCSVWAKGYFRKAVTLSSLGRYEEAFITLTVCLYLVKATKINDEMAVLPLKCELLKVLHKIFVQANQKKNDSTVIRRLNSQRPEFALYPDTAQRENQNRKTRRYTTNDVNSRGLCIKKSIQQTRNTRMLNRTSAVVSELKNGFRVRRLFSRAMHETKRIQREVVERTNTAADHPQSSSTPRRSSHLRRVDRSLVSVSDFECTLCYRLFYQPMTTSCGHTFCRGCLERCLDHSNACPLCKSVLDVSLHQNGGTTYFIEIAMQEFLNEESKERVKQHQEELALEAASGSSCGIEIPIFVCTIGFPTVPCPLHVFEPRYRLMIRRSMESGTKRFGMCSYLQEGQNNYADVGTFLEIKNVQYFADGRSVVETVGAKRFKVLRRSQKDGYFTAVVDIINDHPIDSDDRLKIERIHDQVYAEATEWLKSINQVLRQRISTHFGVMPLPEQNWMDLPDGPSWAWWLLAILPLDTKAQLAILSMNKLEIRLESILKVLTYVKSNNTAGAKESLPGLESGV